MNPHKVQTIIDWATLAFICDVQCFLGFINFYWHFIGHYFTIVALLTLGEIIINLPTPNRQANEMGQSSHGVIFAMHNQSS